MENVRTLLLTAGGSIYSTQIGGNKTKVLITEHSECIVSISDLREIIRNAYTAGAHDATATALASIPTTFLAEDYLQELEKEWVKG